VSLTGQLAYVLLVDLDAESRAARDGDHAVVVGEDGRVGEVVQEIVAGVVAETTAGSMVDLSMGD
jgi:hypothetical protein